MAYPRHCVMRETTISVLWNYYFTIFYKMLLDKQFKKNSYVCARSSHFLGGKVFDSKRAGKNNNDCVLKGISKKQFFLVISQYLPY